VKYRGDSGLNDGNQAKTNLIGGYYDSGNNIKFTFTTAYTMTLLSWSAVEYQTKYADIDELDHVKDIIRWGTDYLLKAFIPPNGSNHTMYSQARYKFLDHLQYLFGLTYLSYLSTDIITCETLWKTYGNIL
jgi:hypothetical protein